MKKNWQNPGFQRFQLLECMDASLKQHHGQPQLQDDQEEHEATGHGLWKPNATVDLYNINLS